MFYFAFFIFPFLSIVIRIVNRVPERERVTGIPPLRALVLAFRNATDRDVEKDIHVRQFGSDGYSRVAICVM